MEWGGAATPGMTLVFRAAALDTAIFNRDLDVYILNGLSEERLISADDGTRLKWDRSGIQTYINPDNVLNWHVYRITTSGSAFELFLDEDPLSYINTNGISTADKYFRFGDGGGSLHGAKYDWIAWDTTGAYPPGFGTPLPDSLYISGDVAVKGETSLHPIGFSLNQNYPNPFNPVTDIQYSIGQAVAVRLDVYDLSGQLVRSLINERKQPGTYVAAWDGRDARGNRLSTGVYLYTLQAGDTRTTRKMLLLK